MKILLDTSWLMLSAELGRNLIELAEEALGERLELHILDDIVRELNGLASGVGKRARMARVALTLSKKARRIRYPGEKPVDSKLLEAAKELGMAIATADSDLARRAREEGVAVLIVHEDMRVSLEGGARGLR